MPKPNAPRKRGKFKRTPYPRNRKVRRNVFSSGPDAFRIYRQWAATRSRRNNAAAKIQAIIRRRRTRRFTRWIPKPIRPRKFYGFK